MRFNHMHEIPIKKYMAKPTNWASIVYQAVEFPKVVYQIYDRYNQLIRLRAA